MKPFLSVAVISSLCVPACTKAIDPEGYKQAVKSGFSKIPEALQIEGVFGEADHFITYSGANIPKDWHTEVFFAGRYSLTMQVEVTTDSGFSKIMEVKGRPRFYLQEVGMVDITPSGSVETSFLNEWKFSSEDWKKIIEANGDLSVIGIPIKHNDPVKNFDAYSSSEGRVKVRPD